MAGNFIMRRYQDRDFIIQKKATFLFWFCLALAVLLTILYIITVARDPASAVNTAIAIFPVVAVALLCLLLVLLGKYGAAGQILCGIIAFGVLYGVYFNGENAFSSSSHYGPGLMILAVMFTNKKTTTVYLSLFLIAYFANFAVNSEIITATPVLSTSFNDSLITLLLTFTIALLIDYTLSLALDMTRSESREKEKRHVSFMTRLFETIKEQIRRLSSSSQEMSGTAREFQENAQNQAAFVEQVTSTMEEVAGSVENISNSASGQYASINTLLVTMSELSSIITGMGSEIAGAMKVTAEISDKTRAGEDSLKNMNNTMAMIIQSSREMTNIVEIINDISDRINLLSLNAAIEAARAGESGRGFAVVADEISKLADQTATSIKSIDDLINANNRHITAGMNSVNETIEIMGDILDGITVISEKSSQINATMDRQVATNDAVNIEAERTRNLSNEIKNATEELRLVVDEITKSINSINELVQAHAAGALKISGNAETVNGIALLLNQEIGRNEE